ncbi:MAG TPA: hypothetical protein VKY62_10735 [Devosia sp.]|nr:hypothetical protein [Devosia sp.]
MADRPEDHPDFAMDNVVDPVSGQNNSAKPPNPYPARGWARNEIPPRQYDNWLKRTIALWIRWLEQKVDEFSGIFNAATPEPTPETLISRDEDGRAQVADPEEEQDVANRRFVLSSLPEVPGFSTEPQALAGTDSSTIMTPQRTAQAIDARSPWLRCNFGGLVSDETVILCSYDIGPPGPTYGLMRITIPDVPERPSVRMRPGMTVYLGSFSGGASGALQDGGYVVGTVESDTEILVAVPFGTTGSGDVEWRFLAGTEDADPDNTGVIFITRAKAGQYIINPVLPSREPPLAYGVNHGIAIGSARSASAILHVDAPIGAQDLLSPTAELQLSVMGTRYIRTAAANGTPTDAVDVTVAAFRTLRLQ